MILMHIAERDIAEAIQRIIRDGIPSRNRGRGYCLVTNGGHLPPKYTIALAHEIATGEWLHSNRFSGGTESNEFLRRSGFEVVKCKCGGSVYDDRARSAPSSSAGKERTAASRRHSERCPDCKTRITELLERIYGTCVRNHRLRWQTGLAPYEATPIGSVLRDVAQHLKAYRGHGVDEFARRNVLAPCDYWVPDPGFIVEFDESQHFTRLRRIALSVYADMGSLGFSTKRWMDLCEHHNARDNDPPYRDEQRAWYDTLRDLVPSIMGIQPTVRLYASDLVWCSLDPDSREDQEHFKRLLHEGCSSSSLTTTGIRSAAVRPESTLRVAMVFPTVAQKSSDGFPQPDVPMAASFAGEAVDLVLFPEGYISASDQARTESLKKLASNLGAPLLVGAIDKSIDSSGRCWQVLLRFDPDGFCSRVYIKHSAADAVAFELSDWEQNFRLPTLELGGVTAGATICQDHYLGLLARFLAKRGARLWVNPSDNNVVDIKWSSLLRLRAVENGFFALCTLHCDEGKGKTHPFAFAPNGAELKARPAGSDMEQPMSKCSEAGKVYIVDLDMATVEEPLNWSKLPPAEKPKRAPNGNLRKPVRVRLSGGQPAVVDSLGTTITDLASCIETAHGSVYVGVIQGKQILDAAECFRVIDHARQRNCAPIIWNHWEQLPADSAHLATLMMGRAIECCAPIVVSDRCGVHELVELSNKNKIPARRVMESSGDAIVDIGYAWGRDNAFRMVTSHLPAPKAERALDHYRSLM